MTLAPRLRLLVFALVASSCTSSADRMPADARPLATAVQPAVEAKRETRRDGSEERKEGAPDPAMREMPSPMPTGDVVTVYACSHSAQPFGDSFFRHAVSVDLAHAAVAIDRVEGKESDDDRPPGTPSANKETHETKQLTAAEKVELQELLDAVLKGGPYRAEYPVPEGVSCTLSLKIGDAPPFFEIDKGNHLIPDEVNKLIEKLPGTMN